MAKMKKAAAVPNKKRAGTRSKPVAPAAPAKFEMLDCVRLLVGGRGVGVVTGIATYHKGETEYYVRSRSDTRWLPGSCLTAA